MRRTVGIWGFMQFVFQNNNNFLTMAYNILMNDNKWEKVS